MGQDFLDNGDIVKCGGVDNHTQNCIIGGCGDGDGEEGRVLGDERRVTGTKDKRGVELVVVKGVIGCGEVHRSGVEHLVANGMMTGNGEECDEESAQKCDGAVQSGRIYTYKNIR